MPFSNEHAKAPMPSMLTTSPCLHALKRPRAPAEGREESRGRGHLEEELEEVEELEGSRRWRWRCGDLQGGSSPACGGGRLRG